MLSNKELIDELSKRLLENENCKNLLKKQAEDLKLVNSKLAESESLKSHFISNVTNEIVNPFASILGLSKNIMASKDSDVKSKNMAELIHSEAFELDFQLKNIFAAAKIEAGEAEPEFVKVDIEQLMQSVVSAYMYKAEQKQLHINFSFELDNELKDHKYFKTDPEKLKLILSNLLSNSIKYSNAANKIEIKGWIEEGRSLKVTVKDYGVGIDKENLELIFDRFKRLDNTINSINTGHGLGLSVSKAMADALNGEIEIASKRNIGSLFTVAIPEGQAEDSDGFAFDGNEFIFEGGGDEVF
jgi:signal transduction histidine kinase